MNYTNDLGGARACRWGAVVAVLLAASGHAHASIQGFNSLTGWTSNRNDSGPPASVIDAGTIQLTSGSPQIRSVFFNTRQDITSFTASFRVQAMALTSIENVGQGVCLVFQNSTPGPAALGLGNGALGLTGISLARGLVLYSNGNTRSAWGVAPGDQTGAARLENLRPLDVVATYAGSEMQVTIDDPTLPGIEYTTTHNVGSLSSQISGTQAYVGFTASTGSSISTGDATFRISNFTFTNVPAPGCVWFVLGAIPLACRRHRKSVVCS